MLQWGRAYSARKTKTETQEVVTYEVASMGPGLFSPEDPDSPAPIETTPRSFNGAGLIQPGRLSWQDCSWPATGASMGPGLFSPEDVGPYVVQFRNNMLQWGRAYSARKT